MTPPSETPRTDEMQRLYSDHAAASPHPGPYLDGWEHSRLLERELSEAQALARINKRKCEERMEERDVAVAEVDRLVRCLSDAVAWIPVSERKPEDDARVVATPSNYKYDGNPTAYYWKFPDHGPHKHGHWYQTDGHGYAYEVPVTHWMPLPEAPK